MSMYTIIKLALLLLLGTEIGFVIKRGIKIDAIEKRLSDIMSIK